MEGTVRKKIALKLKEPPSVVNTPSTMVIPPSTSSSESPDVSGKKVNLPLHKGQKLQWDQPLNLIGRAVTDPLLHICEICDKPILIYGRMKRCRHAFCRDCAKKAGGECPKCHEREQTFEEAAMGTVHICAHGGGRYDNKGCGRSYLSQRDLDAHIAYRHNKDKVTSSSSGITQITLPPTFFPSPVVSGTAVPAAALASFQPQAIPPQIPRPPTGSLPYPPPIPIPGFTPQTGTQARRGESGD